MNATAKTILTLAAVVATVFGVTVIAQYTLKPDKPTDTGKTGDETIEEIVRYDMRQMRFDPASRYLAHRQFPGYFEENESVSSYFWVNNPNPFPVQVSGGRRSCTSCTDVSIAVFDQSSDLDAMIGVGAAILGGAAYAAPDQFNAEAWQRAALAIAPARWQAIDFTKPEAKLNIPAAGETGPTWVAVRVRVNIKPGPHIQIENKSGGISADLTFHAEAAKNPIQTQFVVEYIGVKPFDITPKDLKLGDMTEGVAQSTHDVMYYSSTQANLPPPVLAADQKDPFLKFGEPKLLGEGELKQFIAEQGGARAGVKILAAYRVTVMLSRTSDAKELDIGPLDKSFTVTASSGTGANHSVQAHVKTTVGGVVALEGGTGVIDLGDFNARSGTSKEATLVSEKAGFELEALTEKHHPGFLQVALGEPRIEGPKRFWTITVKIDANQGLGNLPLGSAAVFRVKSTGQIIRIPVKGHGKYSSK